MIRIGQEVIVTKIVEEEEGWQNAWSEFMDDCVGKLHEVIEIGNIVGTRCKCLHPINNPLQRDYWFFPESSLGLAQGFVKKTEDILEEWIK